MTIDTADEIYSDYLFARPSLAEGIGRLVDFSGSLNTYNTSPSPEQADARALEVDLRAVGHDLSVATGRALSESAAGE
jgi:hypothetical protein